VQRRRSEGAPAIRWCTATPGGFESLTGGLRLLAGRDAVVGLDKVREVVDRVAQSSGLEVVDVELHGGGKARMLRIYIDKPGGVTHEDCASFSREVGTIFDVEDVVPGGSYMLEVSSPGLDRRLSRPEEYQRFTGSLVKLMTRDPVNGNRHFEGRLKAFHDGGLSLELTGRKKSKKHHAVEQGTEVEIDLANVEKANLVPELPIGSRKSNK
jgi:ribosome maturation factor RimP